MTRAEFAGAILNRLGIPATAEVRDLIQGQKFAEAHAEIRDTYFLKLYNKSALRQELAAAWRDHVEALLKNQAEGASQQYAALKEAFADDPEVRQLGERIQTLGQGSEAYAKIQKLIDAKKYSEARQELAERMRGKIYFATKPIDQLLVSERVDRISFAEAQKLKKFRAAKVGDQFAPLWATFWFRGRA